MAIGILAATTGIAALNEFFHLDHFRFVFVWGARWYYAIAKVSVKSPRSAQLPPTHSPTHEFVVVSLTRPAGHSHLPENWVSMITETQLKTLSSSPFRQTPVPLAHCSSASQSSPTATGSRHFWFQKTRPSAHGRRQQSSATFSPSTLTGRH